MKFAFIAHSIFDQRMGMGLCQALANILDQDCALVGYQQKTKENLAKFDVIMEPQHGRNDTIPKDAVYIAWCFEYYGAGDPDYSTLAGRDLLYSFCDPDILGLPPFKQRTGSLTVAVEPALLQRPIPEPSLDMSLAGFLPPQAWFYFPQMMPGPHSFNIFAGITSLACEMAKVVPLSGSFDQPAAFATFKEAVTELIEAQGWNLTPDMLAEAHSYGAKLIHNCARLVNRGALAQLALKVSTDIEFWGQHWNIWEPTAQYAHPYTDDLETIYSLYQRSRINLHDNIFGFSQHWRVLEAMAVGGFIMAHESPHFGKAGQMTETF
jgi:hypothetical protein